MDGVNNCAINVGDKTTKSGFDTMETKTTESGNGDCFKLETDDTANCYRRHFVGREHHNFYGKS